MKSFLLLLALTLFIPVAHANNLPTVTGVELVDDQMSWDAQEGAVGFNIYFNGQYYDTVRDTTRYSVTEPGRYNLTSFNDDGVFSLVNWGDEVTYEGASQDGTVYNFQVFALYVTKTCSNVGPGESCIAQCPGSFRPSDFGNNLPPNRIYTFTHVSGGACSTSDIVEADALVSDNNYRCTVPTFSGEVTAQAVCAVRR